MAATIPLWAIGRHVTALNLTPQSVNTSTGVLTDTTPVYSFFGHLENVEMETSYTLENISAMDRPVENNVPIETGITLRLTELEVYGGSGNFGASAAYGATYYKYTLTRGNNSFTGYGIISNQKTSATKPKVTGTIELKMIDGGASTALPSYG